MILLYKLSLFFPFNHLYHLSVQSSHSHFSHICPLCVLDILVSMGYARKDIEESLKHNKYDEIMATYLLLGYKPLDVSWQSL